MTLKKTSAKIYESLRLLYGVRYNKHYKKSDERIHHLNNIHLGGRCFIIGTSPSLNKTDFTPIKNEVLFGTNKLYIGIEKFGIHPQYWVVADTILFDYTRFDLLKLNTTLFLTNGAGQLYLNYTGVHKNDKQPIVIRPLSDMKTTHEFSKDLLVGANGGMVTLSCLQIAYYMGFKEVYLVGCDCSSKNTHYYDNEKQPGDDDWEPLFRTYRDCKKVYESNGRKIYNSTVGGELEVFERIKLEDIK